MSSGMQAADGITDLLFHSPPTALVSVLPPQDVPRTRVADQVYIDELTGDVVTLSSYETRPTAPSNSNSTTTTTTPPPVTKRSCEARFYGNPVVPLEAVGSCGATSAASLQNDRETYQRTNYLITSITLATSSSKAGSSAKTIVAARRFPRPVQVRTAAATPSSSSPPTSPAGTNTAAEGYELRYLVALSMDDQTIHFYITPPAHSGSGDLQPISVGSYACSPNTLRFRQSSYPIRGFQWCPNSAVTDHWRQHQSTKAASRAASSPESLAELSLTATSAHTDDPTDVWANANRSFYYRSKVLLGGGGYSIPPPPETGDLPMKKLLKSLPPTARDKAHRIFQQACGSATGEALGLAETAHGVSLSSAVEQLHTCLQRDQLLMVWTEIGVDLVYVNFTRDSTTGVSAAQKRDAFEHLASPLGGASSSSSSGNGGAEPSGIISPTTSGCTGMIVVLRRVPTRIDFWTTLPSMHVSLVINSAKATNVKPIAELGAYTWIMPQFKIPGLNPITPPAAPKYRTQQAAIAAARLPQSFVANMQFPTTGPHLSTNMLFPTIASTEASSSSGTPPAFATGAWSQTSHCSQITQPQSFYPLQVLQLHDELYIAFVDYSKGHVVMYRYQHNNHSGRTADLGSAMLSDDYGDRYSQWAQNNSTVTTTNRPANPARSGASTLVRYFNAAVDSGVTPGSSFASAERRAGGGPDAMTTLPVAADLLRGASEANLTEEEKDHILRIASEAAAAIAEDVKGLDVEGLTGSDGFRGNLRRLKVGSKLQPLSDYAADPYKVVDQEFQVGTLMAEGQPMPALTTLQATPEYGCGGVNAPLSNLAAHALLGRGLQGISAAASTNKKSSSSGGGGVPLPCAFVPIPDVVAQVVASLEKGASSSGTSASGSNNQQGGGGGNGDVSSGGSIARPPTMGLSTQQPGAGAGSASQSSVLTSKGTSCFVSCYPSARGGATKDGKGFVPSDPSMTGGSMGAAGEQQEGSMATFVVAFVLPLPAHSIVSALRAEWYFGADVQATHRWSEALRAAADDILLTSSNTPLLPPYAVLLQTTSDGLLIAHIPDDGKLAQEVKSEIDAEEFDPLLDGSSTATTGGVNHEEDAQRVAEEVLRPCHLVAAYDVKLAMLKDDTSAASGILAQQQRGLSPMDSNYYSSIRQQQIASTAVSAAGRFVAQHAGLFLKQLHVLPVAPPAPLNPTSTTLTPADTQAIEALEAYELTKTQYLEQSKQIMSDFNCHDARAQCTRYMASYTSHFSYHRLAPFSPVAFAELKDQIIEATSMEAMQTNASTSKGPSRKIARRLHRAMVEGKAQWVTSLMAARFQELANQRSEAARRTIDGISSIPPTSLYSTDSTFQELARTMNGAVALAMANGGDVGGRWSNTTTTTSSSIVPDSKRGTMRPSGKQGSSLVATMAAVEAQQRMSSATRGSMAADSSSSNNSGGGSKGGWFRNLFSKKGDDGSASNTTPSGSDAALVLSTEGTDVHEGVPIVHHLPLWCLEGALPNSILDKLIQSPRGNTSIPPVAPCAGSTRVVIGSSQPRLLNSWSTPTVPTLAMLGDMGLAPSSPRRANSDNRPPAHLLPPSYRFVSTIVGYNAMAIVRSFGVDHEAMWSWWPMALRRLMLQGTLSTDQLDALDGLPTDDDSPAGSTVSKTSSRQKQGRLSALPPMSVTGGLSCPRSRLPFGVYDAMFIFAVQFLLYRRAHTVVAYKEASAIDSGEDDVEANTSSSSVFVVPFAEIASRLALHTALNFESLSLVGRIFDVMVAHQRSHIAECSWFNFWQSRWRGAMISDSGATAASNVSLASEATQSWRSLLLEGFLVGSSLTNVTTSTPDTTAEFVRYVRSLYQPHLWPINTAYHVGGGSTRRELLLSTYTSSSPGINSMGSATSSTDDIGSGSSMGGSGSGGVDGRLSLHLVRPAVDAGHMYRSVFEELLRVSESCRATTSIGSQQSFGPSGARLEGVFVRNYVLHCFFEYARSLVQHGLSLSVPLQSSLIDLMLSTAKPLPQQQQQVIITSTSSSPTCSAIISSTGTPPNVATPSSLGGRSPVSAFSEPHQGSDAGATESSYFRLHQLLMYKALEDHVPTALQLISLHSDYPPAFQLGLDILSRLRAHSEIIMVFLSKGMPLRAAKYLLSLKRETIAAHGSLARQLIKLQNVDNNKDEDPTGDNARRTLQNLQTVSQQLYPSNTDLFSVIGILDSAAAMHDAELLSLCAEGEPAPGPTLAPGEEDPRTERQKVTVYLRNRLITKRQKYKQELGAAGAQFYSIYTLVVTQYLDLAVRSRSNDGGASKNGSFTNTSSSSTSASQLLLHFPNLKPFKVRYDLINTGNISGLYLLVQNKDVSENTK